MRTAFRCLVALLSLLSLFPGAAQAESLSVIVELRGEGSDPAEAAMVQRLKAEGFGINDGKDEENPPHVSVTGEVAAVVVSERKYKGHIMFVAEATITIQALRSESETLVMATSNAFKNAGRSAEEAKDRARASLTEYVKETMAKEVADGIRQGY